MSTKINTSAIDQHKLYFLNSMYMRQRVKWLYKRKAVLVSIWSILKNENHSLIPQERQQNRKNFLFRKFRLMESNMRHMQQWQV